MQDKLSIMKIHSFDCSNDDGISFCSRKMQQCEYSCAEGVYIFYDNARMVVSKIGKPNISCLDLF